MKLYYAIVDKKTGEIMNNECGMVDEIYTGKERAIYEHKTFENHKNYEIRTCQIKLGKRVK